jgi:hypothetical protein
VVGLLDQPLVALDAEEDEARLVALGDGDRTAKASAMMSPDFRERSLVE